MPYLLFRIDIAILNRREATLRKPPPTFTAFPFSSHSLRQKIQDTEVFTTILKEAIVYVGASLLSFLITSKITRILNVEITKISDTRRGSNIIKEAVIKIFDFLFSSLTTSHTNP